MHYLSAWHVGLDVLGWLFVDHLKRFPLFCRSNSLIDTLRLHFYHRLIPTAPSQIGRPAEALWLLFKLQLVTQGCSYESA